jgi:hypothetical protein
VGEGEWVENGGFGEDLLGVYDGCYVSVLFLIIEGDLLIKWRDRGEYSTFDRNFDISEARRIGFKESVDHVKGYHIAFDRMRAAKIIP